MYNYIASGYLWKGCVKKKEYIKVEHQSYIFLHSTIMHKTFPESFSLHFNDILPDLHNTTKYHDIGLLVLGLEY
jgi:hypothetical protein